MRTFARILKPAMFLGAGAMAGAFLGYVSQCAGGSCPLLCVWWRGAIFGAVAGLVLWFANAPGSTQVEMKRRE